MNTNPRDQLSPAELDAVTWFEKATGGPLPPPINTVDELRVRAHEAIIERARCEAEAADYERQRAELTAKLARKNATLERLTAERDITAALRAGGVDHMLDAAVALHVGKATVQWDAERKTITNIHIDGMAVEAHIAAWLTSKAGAPFLSGKPAAPVLHLAPSEGPALSLVEVARLLETDPAAARRLMAAANWHNEPEEKQ